MPHVVAELADGDIATRYLTLVAATVSAWSASAYLDEPVLARWGEVEGRTAIWGFTNETWSAISGGGVPSRRSPRQPVGRLAGAAGLDRPQASRKRWRGWERCPNRAASSLEDCAE